MDEPTPTPESSRPTGAARTRASGDTIAGKYLVRELLGEGGMGLVFEAVHLTLGQPVAIKLLRPEIAAKAEAVARFLREARAAARIGGEHAVRIFDVDRDEAGVPYIVMERLRGASLDAVLARAGRLPVEQAVDYVLSAAVAVAEAHANGIVHRDLKPQNLFVVERAAGAARVKVLDFGISKTLDADPSTSVVTGPNVAMGSPEYMSPEQVRHADKVDARSDLWSLGVILYELLTGQLPFEADSIPHLFVRILTESPTPLAALRPELPEELARLVHNCLARDPAERPADVGALAAALAPFGGPDAPALSRAVSAALGQVPAPPASHGEAPPRSVRVSPMPVTLGDTAAIVPASTPNVARNASWIRLAPLLVLGAVLALVFGRWSSGDGGAAARASGGTAGAPSIAPQPSASDGEPRPAQPSGHTATGSPSASGASSVFGTSAMPGPSPRATASARPSAPSSADAPTATLAGSARPASGKPTTVGKPTTLRTLDDMQALP
jgi:serine/threonine protein kinase